MSRQNGNTTTTKGRRCTFDIPGLGLVDGRSREGRLYGQAVADIAGDLGGEDHLTRMQMELIRRAAGLSVLAAVSETRLLNGDPIDVTELTSVGNAQRRLLVTLGLERRARDVTPPSLREYARRKSEVTS